MAEVLSRRAWLHRAAALAAASSVPLPVRACLAAQTRSQPQTQPQQAPTPGASATPTANPSVKPPQPPAGSPPGMDLLGADSLRTRAEAKSLLVGFAINSRLLRESEAYRQAVSTQSNLIVGENCMKWAPLRPTAATFNFTEADELVTFAEKHEIKVRGHNLCWHENLPPWFATTVNRANAAQVLTDHIRTVAGRYKGRIHSWDVVNEAINPQDGRPDGLRTSPWLDLLGPGYIELAFRTAREADPAALLTYNDFGIEYDTPAEQAKRAAVLSLVTRLRDAHVPIDAVGIQSHLTTTDAIRLGDGIRTFTKDLRKLRLAAYITELDVDDDTLPDLETLQRDRDIASIYRRYLDATLESPATRAIVVWGVADSQSWLQADKQRPKHPSRPQRPLPFLVDETGQYRVKPAFFAIRDAIDLARPRS